MRLLWIIFALVAPASASPGQADGPGLTLTLSTPRASYAQGEAVEVTAHYANTGGQPLAIDDFSLLRGQIINQEFTVRAVDAQGRPAPDPLGPPRAIIIDRFSARREITAARPYAQTFTLNEWVWFRRPGRYAVTATSRLAYRSDTRPFQSVPVSSGPLTLDIRPADPARRRQDLALAEADFRHGTPGTQIAAIRKVRFWNTPEAIPLLTAALAREDTAGDAQLGLATLAATTPAPVRAAVRRAFEDPSRLIGPRDIWPYLNVLAETDARPGTGGRWREEYAARLRRRLPCLTPARAVNLTVDGLAFGPLLSWDDPYNWRRVLRDFRQIDAGRRPSALIVLRQDCRLKSVVPYLKRLIASLSGPADAAAFADYRDAAQAALTATEK